MKHIQYLVLVTALVTFTGCDAIASIFEAGVWSGIIIVVLVVALIIWLINRARR